MLMELIGTTEKGGFRDFEEVSQSLYPDHELFTLQRGRKARLGPLNWNKENAIFVPKESILCFADMIVA